MAWHCTGVELVLRLTVSKSAGDQAATPSQKEATSPTKDASQPDKGATQPQANPGGAPQPAANATGPTLATLYLKPTNQINQRNVTVVLTTRDCSAERLARATAAASQGGSGGATTRQPSGAAPTATPVPPKKASATRPFYSTVNYEISGGLQI